MPRIVAALAVAALGAERDTARAMSDREDQEIISSLRRTYQAFSRADFDGAAELMHPEIEYVPVGDQTPLRGGGRAAGLDEARRL